MTQKSLKDLRDKYKAILLARLSEDGCVNPGFLIDETLDKLFDELAKDLERYR